MRRAFVHKAEPTGPADARDYWGVIQISETLPPVSSPDLKRPFRASVKNRQRAYDKDARAIIRVLNDCLPGATLDRVVAGLLRLKASHLVVSYNSLFKSKRNTPPRGRK